MRTDEVRGAKPPRFLLLGGLEMKILAVGAHPDDLELSCGGALAKYAANGHNIGMAIMTDGATGSPTLPAGEIAAIRKEEAAASARIIGADFFWLGFPDGKLEYSVAVRMELNKIIRAFDPGLIITHNPEDYISDHRITSRHVVDAGLWSHVGPLIPELPPTRQSPPIAFMDTFSGTNFIPEHYIDTTDYFETKEKMLASHKSQQKWLDYYGGVDYMEVIHITSRYRGLQSSVKYAEGFRIWQGWQTSRCGSVLPD